MTEPFKTTKRVEFCETDLAGIVHFSNFYRYMEQAEHEYFRSLGLSIVHQTEDGGSIGWPRVSAACSFYHPARYEDVLDISVYVTRKGVKSLTYQVDFKLDGMLIVKGTMKSVCCFFKPHEKMHSIEIPEPYSQLIQESTPPGSEK